MQSLHVCAETRLYLTRFQAEQPEDLVRPHHFVADEVMLKGSDFCEPLRFEETPLAVFQGAERPLTFGYVGTRAAVRILNFEKTPLIRMEPLGVTARQIVALQRPLCYY